MKTATVFNDVNGTCVRRGLAVAPSGDQWVAIAYPTSALLSAVLHQELFAEWGTLILDPPEKSECLEEERNAMGALEPAASCIRRRKPAPLSSDSRFRRKDLPRTATSPTTVTTGRLLCRPLRSSVPLWPDPVSKPPGRQGLAPMQTRWMSWLTYRHSVSFIVGRVDSEVDRPDQDVAHGRHGQGITTYLGRVAGSDGLSPCRVSRRLLPRSAGDGSIENNLAAS